MPTYEYQCQSCGTRVEAVQSFHDPALTTCEECGGELRKVFSPVGIVFKGSGFYKNDSRPAPKSSDSSTSSSAAKSESSAAKAESSSPSSPAPAAAPAAASSSSTSSSSGD